MFITATIPTTVSDAPSQVGTSCTPDERERERVEPDAEADRDRGGEHLPAELLPPAEAAEVVDRADGRRDRSAEQNAAHLAAERQERERRHEDAEEQREPAEPRDTAAPARPSRGRSTAAEQRAPCRRRPA